MKLPCLAKSLIIKADDAAFANDLDFSYEDPNGSIFELL